MKKINVELLKPGITFTNTTFLTPGNVFCLANKVVKKEDIDRLKRWGIKEILTDGEIIYPKAEDVRTTQDEKIAREFQRLKDKKQGLKEIYSNCLTNLKKIFDDLKNEKTVNIDNLKSIINLLVRGVETSKELLLNFISTMSVEDYIPSHSLNVANLALLIADELNYNATKKNDLGLGALLHDVGMLFIPDAIIKKEGKLTEEEYNKIKAHPVLGYKIVVQNLKLRGDIADVSLQHQEQYDGKGYPQHLKGEAISEFARIVSVADAFDAITKKRSYHDEVISYVAMNEVLSSSRKKFDPGILKSFLSIMSIYPVGSIVKLNNNSVAMIVKSNEKIPIRPIIKLIIDEFGDKVKDEIFFDLSERADITIKSVVDYHKIGLKPFEIL